jgi:putative ABC transport system substrate-binding protein
MRKPLVVFVGIAFLIAIGYRADAQSQAKKVPRIGFIFSSGTPGDPSPQLEAFRLGLRNLGYLDGKDVVIERRYAEGRLDRMPPFVHEFIQQQVDVIVAGNSVVIKAAREATTTIPIVMISAIDPVAAGYVESFARPGGNITGLAWLARDLSAKRVELLKELSPSISRISVLWDADGPGPIVAFKEYMTAARAFKLNLQSLAIRGPSPDFAGTFQAAKAARAEALIVVGNPLMGQHAKEVFELAAKYHLPSMTEEARYVDAGGLISYGANAADLYRRAANYVVEILKGAKPGDLPVKLPEKFEIFVNLKTARAVRVVIPQTVLIKADTVIK